MLSGRGPSWSSPRTNSKTLSRACCLAIWKDRAELLITAGHHDSELLEAVEAGFGQREAEDSTVGRVPRAGDDAVGFEPIDVAQEGRAAHVGEPGDLDLRRTWLWRHRDVEQHDPLGDG